MLRQYELMAVSHITHSSRIPNSHIYPPASKSPLGWNCKRPIPGSQGSTYAGLNRHKYLTDRHPPLRSVTDIYADSVRPENEPRDENYRKSGHLYLPGVIIPPDPMLH